MAGRIVVAGALAVILAAGQAAAETRMVQGGQLVLTSTLNSDFRIVTDPTLSRSMRISADGGLSCLSVTEGRTVVIDTAACGGDFEDFQVAIPPDAPVTLTTSGGADVQIGNLRASLTASVIGGGDLKVGAVQGVTLTSQGSGDVSVGAVDGSANLQLTGKGDVRLAALNGPLSVRHTGSGDLAVGSIDARVVDLENSGSGDTLIGGGSIGTLHVRTDGSGDLAVAATVDGGDVSARGGGDVKLGRVNGPLSRSASGGSDIVVGGSAVVSGIIADIAKGVGEADDPPGKHGRTADAHAATDLMHFLMFVVVAVTAFLIWRIVRRNGGFAALGRRGGAGLPDRPQHPGVFAISETMSRLEQRLGRIESYVTTREFDLNRKFRDLR